MSLFYKNPHPLINIFPLFTFFKLFYSQRFKRIGSGGSRCLHRGLVGGVRMWIVALLVKLEMEVAWPVGTKQTPFVSLLPTWGKMSVGKMRLLGNPLAFCWRDQSELKRGRSWWSFMSM
jgi:hypothetical protein